MRLAVLLILFLSVPCTNTLLYKVSKGPIYFGAGTLFQAASDLAQLGWGASQFTPWAPTVGNEFLLFSQLCTSTTGHIFTHAFKEPSSSLPSPQLSWHTNQALLSNVPASSPHDLQLLDFLTERWLAKMAGFSSIGADWFYPCFGVHLQVHPSTSHSYARLLTTGCSKTYKNRVETWKQSLPHPHYFPLILTRPANIQEYLPPSIKISQQEETCAAVERLALQMHQGNAKLIVDATPLPSDSAAYLESFARSCKERKLDLSRIICIQRIQQGEMGGIRVLALTGQPLELLEEHHRFLIDWVSCFGLSANRVELDRWPISTHLTAEGKALLEPLSSREEFLSMLSVFDHTWETAPLHKTIMLQGTVQVLKGLFAHLTDNRWDEILRSPTRSSVVRLSLVHIKRQLELLAQKEQELSFFDMASHLEQVHADFSSLLEIFAPFSADRFPAIYRDLLSIPSDLKPLTSCGIHSSAMTSLAGILKAVCEMSGKQPRVLYGENTYFECVGAIKKVTRASPTNEATEEDWEQTDLVLAQFNPVIKPGILTEYRVEKIGEILHKLLSAKRHTPLTLALDCTLDFIDSPRVTQLLHEFQKEIAEGKLNVVGYRSGNKFDLFGMDNYCGAPFFMIHNQDPKWAPFHSLSTDPVLQTDPLSLNWFCLAYQCAAPYLELYRKQVFENTRSFLSKIPARLLNDRAITYQVSPFEQEAEPAFIDIKVTGPFHKIRTSALVSGLLYVTGMEGGHPIFNRPSLGFYHPNFVTFLDEEISTIRLTLGLDPAQVDLFAACLKRIDSFNGRL